MPPFVLPLLAFLILGFVIMTVIFYATTFFFIGAFMLGVDPDSYLLVAFMMFGVAALTGYLMRTFYKHLFMDVLGKNHYSAPLVGLGITLLMSLFFYLTFRSYFV